MIHRKASAEARLWYPAFLVLKCFIESRYIVRVINDVIWCHLEISRLEAPTFPVTEWKINWLLIVGVVNVSCQPKINRDSGEARAGLYLGETKEAFVINQGTDSCLRTGHLTYGRILLTTPKLWEYTYSGLACGSWSHLKGAVV